MFRTTQPRPVLKSNVFKESDSQENLQIAIKPSAISEPVFENPEMKYIAGSLPVSENVEVFSPYHSHIVIGIEEGENIIVKALLTSDKGLQAGNTKGVGTTVKLSDTQPGGEPKGQYVRGVYPPFAIKKTDFEINDKFTGYVNEVLVQAPLEAVMASTDVYEPVKFNPNIYSLDDLDYMLELKRELNEEKILSQNNQSDINEKTGLN